MIIQPVFDVVESEEGLDVKGIHNEWSRVLGEDCEAEVLSPIEYNQSSSELSWPEIYQSLPDRNDALIAYFPAIDWFQEGSFTFVQDFFHEARNLEDSFWERASIPLDNRHHPNVQLFNREGVRKVFVDYTDRFGNSPLHQVAASHSHLMALLLKRRQDFSRVFREYIARSDESDDSYLEIFNTACLALRVPTIFDTACFQQATSGVIVVGDRPYVARNLGRFLNLKFPELQIDVLLTGNVKIEQLATESWVSSEVSDRDYDFLIEPVFQELGVPKVRPATNYSEKAFVANYASSEFYPASEIRQKLRKFARILRY